MGHNMLMHRGGFSHFLDLWGVPLEFYFALSIYLVLFGDSFHFCPMAGLH